MIKCEKCGRYIDIGNTVKQHQFNYKCNKCDNLVHTFNNFDEVFQYTLNKIKKATA